MSEVVEVKAYWKYALYASYVQCVILADNCEIKMPKELFENFSNKCLKALLEKDQSLMDYRESVEILQIKVRKLEQLVLLKDKRIEGAVIISSEVISELV